MEKERTWERERERRRDRRIKLISLFFQDILWKLHAVHHTNVNSLWKKEELHTRKSDCRKKLQSFNHHLMCVCVIYMKWANEPHYSTSWSFMNFSSNHDCFCWCPFRLGLRVYRESGVCRLISQHHIRHQTFWLLFSFFFSRNNFLIWLNMILCVYLCLFS